MLYLTYKKEEKTIIYYIKTFFPIIEVNSVKENRKKICYKNAIKNNCWENREQDAVDWFLHNLM